MKYNKFRTLSIFLVISLLLFSAFSPAAFAVCEGGGVKDAVPLPMPKEGGRPTAPSTSEESERPTAPSAAEGEDALVSAEADATAFAGAETADSASEEAVPVVADDMKVSSRFLELLLGKGEKKKTLSLIPGGNIFGVKIRQCGVSITEITDNVGKTPLAVGDVILSVNGESVSGAADVSEKIRRSEGEILLRIRRGGEEMELAVTPEGGSGAARLGILVRDGAAGIGTVTFIDPETGAFGGLGHGICDPDTGELIEMEEGSVTGVILGGVRRGESGKPGELHGVLKRDVIGELCENSECGVFGVFRDVDTSAEAIPVGTRDEVHEGRATILSTVKGETPMSYEINIHEIHKNAGNTKSFRITVTDPTLLAMTGGIVRGMSGSPIIQDGKLIGAVTHVMVGDPTEGYGIFIENMLNASEIARNELPKAA